MSKSLDPLRTTTLELPHREKIILVGDSWSCGEYAPGGKNGWLHLGLEQYLLDDGYDVINYGIGGGSNSLSYLRVLEAIAHTHVDWNDTKVFLFWTDWHRDFYRNFDIIDFVGIKEENSNQEWQPKIYDEETPHRCADRIFAKLDAIGLQIGLIGGCVDSVPVPDIYSNLYIACQSFVNLCLHDIDTIDDPVYSVFTKPEFGSRSFLRSSVFLDDISKANTRRLQWQQNPQWFWPDGKHANRRAHRKLYDFLKSKSLV